MASCVEERIVGGRAPFSGLPGAETNIVIPSDRDADPAAALTPTSPIEVAEDGAVTYRPRTGSALLRCLVHALDNEQREALAEQLLGKTTRAEYQERGLDPIEAFDALRERERDIRALYARMPGGEFSPGVRMRTVGRNILRIYPSSPADLTWNFMDVEHERGLYKLRWFGRR